MFAIIDYSFCDVKPHTVLVLMILISFWLWPLTNKYNPQHHLWPEYLPFFLSRHRTSGPRSSGLLRTQITVIMTTSFFFLSFFLYQQLVNTPLCFQSLKQSTLQKETYGKKASWSCTSRWERDRETKKRFHLVGILVAFTDSLFYVLRSSITVFTSGWIINGIS